jgi:hypothetical protein
MPDPIYAIHTPKQLKAKHERILAIVKADPEIGLDRIFELYYEPNPTRPIARRKSLLNLLTSLCSSRQLTYIKGIDGYAIQD